MQPSSNRRSLSWIVLSVSALVGIGLFFIPAFVIRPFSYQSPKGLALAMFLRQYAPWGTLGSALVCLLIVLTLWGTVNRWRKAVLAAAMLPVLFATVMARLNYFEWMFHPIKSQQFESASTSKLASGEMILAVRDGADARAYPIREMAYHHILNDVVGSVPIAVTY